MQPTRSEPRAHRRARTTWPRAWASASLLVLGCASANDGQLDPSFGTDGIVAIEGVPAAQVTLTRAYAAVEDSLGRTLLIGRGATGDAETYADSYVVVALGDGGAIDTGYGVQGTASLAITPGSDVTPFKDVSMDAVLLPDQRIAVCVSIADADTQPAVFLFALTAAGQVDGSFGPGGQPGFLYFGYPRSIFDYLVVPGCGMALSDGALYVSGPAGPGAPGSVAIARLTATGAYDTNWSGDGIAYADALPAPLAVQGDGKFLLLTVESIMDGSVAGVVRVRADGTIDDDYGVEGVALADLGTGYDNPLALTVDTQGRALLGGYTLIFPQFVTTCGTCIARLTAGGALDSSFNPSGAVSGTPGVVRLADIPTIPGRIVATSAEKILVAMTAWNGPYPTQGVPPFDEDFLAVRLLDDGSPDPDYGGPATPGYAYVDIDANTVSDDVVSPGAFVNADGRTVLTGTSVVKNGEDNVLRFAAARLVDGDLFSDGFE
jgi:uncharacterized delta-60 repeat protein